MKSPVVAFFLTFISGLGHLYIGRFIRAFFYLGGSIGIILLSAFIYFTTNGEELAIFFGAIGVFILWGINMLDMIVTILNKHNGVFTPKPIYQIVNGQIVLVPQTPSDPLLQAQSDERIKIILLSIIPGLAHLYMNLLKRGISILVSFFAVF